MFTGPCIGAFNRFTEMGNPQKMNGMDLPDKLKNPQIEGFGISDNKTFSQATEYAKGAIIGSAFIKHLSKNGTENIKSFVDTILK